MKWWWGCARSLFCGLRQARSTLVPVAPHRCTALLPIVCAGPKYVVDAAVGPHRKNVQVSRLMVWAGGAW